MVASRPILFAPRPDDEPGDAKTPDGPEPNIAVGTSDSARPPATAGQLRLLRRSRSSANWAPAHDSPHFFLPRILRRFALIPYQRQEFPG